MFYQAKVGLNKHKDTTRSRLQRDNTSLSDLQKETLFKASTLKPCEMIWSQTSVHRVLAENSDLP